MRPFENILAVYNDAPGDDRVLERATALAKESHAKLTLVEAIAARNASAALVVEREQHLSRIAASLGREGMAVSATVLVGIPFLEIVRQVLKERHDLVLMAAEGGGGVRRLFLGSTSMHLMRKCPCPVWVVHPEKGSDYARILAAVDPSSDGQAAEDLNGRILSLAVFLARLHRSQLHIVHAWDLAGTDLYTFRSEITDELRERLLSTNEAMHGELVNRLLERHVPSDLPNRMELVRGNPGILIPQIAEKNRIDLIVMGTVARTGIPGFLIGNTAEFVLRQVECSVLTVKPEGFLTPITLEGEGPPDVNET